MGNMWPSYIFHESDESEDVCMYGDYCVIKFLSKGSCGDIVLARKTGTVQDLYTLKIVPLKYYPETQILQDLRGVPNVIQYVEHFELDADLVIVYKYCEGVELFDFLVENGSLPEERAKNIFRQLCVTMATVHSRGIVHRDLKPENIIIDKHDQITIIDWGFAFYPDRTTERRQCGSPHYACPEIITNTSTYHGPEVDVWSIGCILYAMLSSRMAFGDDYIPALFARIRRCEITYPSYFSEKVINLFQRIFVPNNRPTLKQILADPWLQN